MKPHLLALNLIPWIVLASTANAHPVSHTDAWIRVSDSVDVRLNVFLDDVLRHQNLLPDNQQTISGSVVATAIEAHGKILLRQLRIFDHEGRQLQGQITAIPKWSATQQEVDLSIDASLKLTWKISFQPVDNQAIKHLSFLHHFTHSSLESVGELRLHLQDKNSNRRIDAVIPAERLHTIAFPDRPPNPSAPKADSPSASNQLTSRLLTGPTHINIEFECPLLLLDSAWPGSRKFTSESPVGLQPAKKPTLDEAQAAEVKNEIKVWFATNTDVQINGVNASPERVAVEFIPSQFENDRLTEEAAPLAPVAVFGSNIGVRLSYRRGLSINRVKVRLKNKPGPAISEVHMHVSAGSNRSTQIVPFTDGTSNPSAMLEYAWQNQSSTKLPGRFSELAEYEIVRRKTKFPGRFGILGCAMAIAIGCWLISKSPRRKKSWLDKLSIGLPMISVCSLLIKFLPDTTYVVDKNELMSATASQVSGIYEALQLDNEQLTVAALGTILEDDIREQTYLGTLDSISSASDEPLTSLQSVNVIDCDFLAPDSDSRLTVNCHWTVLASVEHWGHSHERKLLFTGQIGLVRQGPHWKIWSFRPVDTTFAPPEEAGTRKS